MRILPILVIAIGVLAATPTLADAPPDPLKNLPLDDVRIEGGFWYPRLEVVRTATIPHLLAMCESTGRLGNFDKAAGVVEGAHEGWFFNDSDVYKAIEAAAYALVIKRDRTLETEMDALINRIAAAQQPDGYLNTFVTLTDDPQEQRWGNLRVRHELYCAGHLLEAGIAYHEATGKRKLLDVALRLIELIDREFGPDGRAAPPGHEEIELALVKLYDRTNERKHLDLARFFVEQRGRHAQRESWGMYCQDHAPVREHDQIVGHAVRATYLYSALADLAARVEEPGYVAAMQRIWDDTTRRKMYITGGIGPSSHNEGFTEPFDLPNDSAYAETCAAIGLAFWNHRLNLLHADARYADMVERVLYNGALAGIALDGERFFYTNPLGSIGNHHRKEWYECACCPPNIARFLLSLGRYVYARSERVIYVNQYVESTTGLNVGEIEVELRQETDYPWNDRVELTVESKWPTEFTICVRKPGWCRSMTIEVDGEPLADVTPQRGYIPITRRWKREDIIALQFAMPVERMRADPHVAANVGRIALQRGPLIYCLEDVDNDEHARNITLPCDAELSTKHMPDLLGGVTVIRGSGRKASTTVPDTLYFPAALCAPVDFTAIPYYAWDNRTAGGMTIWIPETSAMSLSTSDAP